MSGRQPRRPAAHRPVPAPTSLSSRAEQVRLFAPAQSKDPRLLLTPPAASHIDAVQRPPLVRRLQVIPLTRQILPRRVHLLDQRNLLRPAPSLQLLLPPNRPLHVLMPFKPNQPVAVVALGEATALPPLVLKHPLQQIARHADVKRVGAARHDVGEVAALVHARMLLPSRPAFL